MGGLTLMTRGTDMYNDTMTVTDAELIDRARSGDSSAFAELWSRHSAAGRSIARRATLSFDADDLVSEAFLRVFRTIQRGGGPTTSFRPYLATAIRNVAATWYARRSVETVDLEERPDLDEAVSEPEYSDVMIDALTIFTELPARWKEALWLSEVEGMSAEQIGRTLAIAPAAAAALTFRARRGLQKAWAQAQTHAA